jgi:hypothetical protein
MNRMHFFKWPLILFLTGLAIRWTGALFKVRHWPYADELLMIGTIIGVTGILFAIIKLINLKRQQ